MIKSSSLPSIVALTSAATLIKFSKQNYDISSQRPLNLKRRTGNSKKSKLMELMKASLMQD